MKILHLMPSFQYSGAEKVAIQIIKMFMSFEGIDMKLCCTKGPIEKYLKEQRINYEALDVFKKRMVKRVIEEYRPDIVHAHDFSASCMAAQFEVPCISHIHNNPLWLSRFCLKSVVYALSIPRFSYVLGVSQSIYDEFIFRKLMKHKFIVLPNVVDKERVVELSNSYKVLKKIDLLFVGRLVHPKNPLGFLEIVKEVVNVRPDFQAYMLGDGDLKRNCEDYVKKFNLNDNVHILGFVENPYPYMKAADILVVPSLYEGFGLVAVESMILGTPVFCNNVGGLPIIVDNHCGAVLSTPQNYVEMILNTKPAQLHVLSDEAKRKADNFCNIEKYKNLLNRVYLMIHG